MDFERVPKSFIVYSAVNMPLVFQNLKYNLSLAFDKFLFGTLQLFCYLFNIF